MKRIYLLQLTIVIMLINSVGMVAANNSEATTKASTLSQVSNIELDATLSCDEEDSSNDILALSTISLNTNWLAFESLSEYQTLFYSHLLQANTLIRAPPTY